MSGDAEKPMHATLDINYGISVGEASGPYHLFGYFDYYPSGGMGDYLGSYETVAEVLSAVANRSAGTGYDNYDVAVEHRRRLCIVRGIL